MGPTHLGHEPDPDDMAPTPGDGEGATTPPDLPEDEAEALGDFA